MPQELLRQKFKEEIKTRKPIRVKTYARILNELYKMLADEAKAEGEYITLIKLMESRGLYDEASAMEEIMEDELEHYKIINDLIDKLER